MPIRSTLALALLAMGAAAAQAGTIQSVATRGALAATETVEWGTAADDGTTFASPYVRLSSPGGVAATASFAAGLTVFVQGGAIYSANFSNGEVLLSSFLDDGPISIGFSTPVRGVGFNIAHLVEGSFTGSLAFYGAGDQLFGSVSVNGSTNLSGDGSASFLGGMSSLVDIVRVDVSVDSQGGSQALSINQMGLNLAPVPEPASLLLMALGGTALLLRGRAAGAARRDRSAA